MTVLCTVREGHEECYFVISQLYVQLYEQYDQEVPESDKDTKQLSNLFSYVVVVVRSWMNALYFYFLRYSTTTVMYYVAVRS